jgi:hypothetical protein
MNTNRFTRWVIDNFFILLLVIYSLLYVRWFVVLPIDDPSWDLGTFAFGLKLLAFTTIISILWRVFLRHNRIQLLFRTATYLGLALTGLYLYSFMPEVEQIASFNGNTYILTYHREFLDNGDYRPLLTKWDSKLSHTINGLGETCCTLRLISDPVSHVVNVVEIVETTQTLAYTDSNPPRTYGTDTQFGMYRYYPSWDCASSQNSICQTYTYTVYRCTVENTSCAQLPFQYSGDYAFDIAMCEDEHTGEIHIYFRIGDYPGVDTLIFTYGDNSQCHVSGCQLLVNQ